MVNFYPRPPRGGRPAGVDPKVAYRPISIHALREEGDWQALLDRADPNDFYPRPPRGGRLAPGLHQLDVLQFLSTPSARRATKYPPPLTMHQYISIHALREEGDVVAIRSDNGILNFYPRPPRGGRP